MNCKLLKYTYTSFFFSILGWHFSVRDKPSALQMIRPLPQHTLRRGKVAGSQLELSSWQHIFADYAKAATLSFRGTSQLFPLPCQSQSQICNRFHLGRAESAPKWCFLHARPRSSNTRSLTAILRGQHQLYQPTEISQAAREGTSTENRLLSSHYVLVPDLLLDELYKNPTVPGKLRSFMLVAKGLLQTQRAPASTQRLMSRSSLTTEVPPQLWPSQVMLLKIKAPLWGETRLKILLTRRQWYAMIHWF